MIWTMADVAAFYAAVVATGALALEVRRWNESGPRLALSTASGMKIVTHGHLGEEEHITVTVSNRGQAPTTITHFGLEVYPNFLSRVRKKPTASYFIPMAALPGGQQLPHVLMPGHHWTGLAEINADVKRFVEEGVLWVYIYSSHREKPFRKHVSRPVKQRETEAVQPS